MKQGVFSLVASAGIITALLRLGILVRHQVSWQQHRSQSMTTLPSGDLASPSTQHAWSLTNEPVAFTPVCCTAERTAEVLSTREELERAQRAHSSLERDLAGALAMQQQEAQAMVKERDSAVARALAAETQAADLKQANDKLFQQQQVPVLPVDRL